MLLMAVSTAVRLMELSVPNDISALATPLMVMDPAVKDAAGAVMVEPCTVVSLTNAKTPLCSVTRLMAVTLAMALEAAAS